MSLLKRLAEFVRSDLPAQAGGAHPEQDVVVSESDLVRVEIVGEGRYQEELLALAGPKTEDGVSKWTLADLVPEPTNPYDVNAVALKIDGVQVGYLARPMAKAFNVMMIGADLKGEPLTQVKAEIRGGWSRSGGDEGHFGVALYLPESIARQLGVQ